MSNNEWEDDNNSGQGDGPKALRDAFEKQKAALAEQQKLIEQLTRDNRANTISGVLKDEGYNPKIAEKIADLIPGDVEASKEKLVAWLEERAELFPKTPASGQTPPSDAASRLAVTAEGTGGEPAVDRIGTAVALGLPPDQIRNVEAEIASAKSPEELERVLGAYRGVRFS